MIKFGLNPRYVGQVFRLKVIVNNYLLFSLNPRYVGQVFRRARLKNSIIFNLLYS